MTEPVYEKLAAERRGGESPADFSASFDQEAFAKAKKKAAEEAAAEDDGLTCDCGGCGESQ